MRERFDSLGSEPREEWGFILKACCKLGLKSTACKRNQIFEVGPGAVVCFAGVCVCVDFQAYPRRISSGFRVLINNLISEFKCVPDSADTESLKTQCYCYAVFCSCPFGFVSFRSKLKSQKGSFSCPCGRFACSYAFKYQDVQTCAAPHQESNYITDIGPL